MARVLALDVGGTHARMGIFEGTTQLRQERHKTAALPPIDVLLERAAREDGVEACGVAIAGPVEGGTARLTHGEWRASQSDFVHAPGILLNDLEAAALAVPVVPPEGVRSLGGPAPAGSGVLAVLGVGTSIGEAFLVGDLPIPSEGGHADWAPHDDRSLELFRWLVKRRGRVFVEDTMSGVGVPLLLAFASEHADMGEEVRKALHTEDPASVMIAWAGADAACALALDLLVGNVGAEAGNMALRMLPRRGLFLIGGIAMALQDRWGSGTAFERAFLDKGPMREILETIPRFLVTYPEPGLLGAAVAASRLV